MSEDGRIAERQMELVLELRKKGVLDTDVLNAMERIDRGKFVPQPFAGKAYDDTPLPIACGQTISQPTVVGIMTQELRLTRRDKVLEVGTGSGYHAAVLSRLARRVYTTDRFRSMVERAREIFREMDIGNITAIVHDGSRGLPEQAPFDRIIVTAAAEDPPGPLLEQLKVGGVMVLPVGLSDTVQQLIRVTRTESGYDYDELMPVRFVPLLEGLGED